MVVCIYYAFLLSNLATSVALDAYLRGSLVSENAVASRYTSALGVCLHRSTVQNGSSLLGYRDLSYGAALQQYEALINDEDMGKKDYYNHLVRYVLKAIQITEHWRVHKRGFPGFPSDPEDKKGKRLGRLHFTTDVTYKWLGIYSGQLEEEQKKAQKEWFPNGKQFKAVKTFYKPIIQSLALALCALNRFEHVASLPVDSAAEDKKKSDIVWFWIDRAGSAFLSAQAQHYYAGMEGGKVENVFSSDRDKLQFVDALLHALRAELDVCTSSGGAFRGDLEAAGDLILQLDTARSGLISDQLIDDDIAEALERFDNAAFIKDASKALERLAAVNLANAAEDFTTDALEDSELHAIRAFF